MKTHERNSLLMLLFGAVLYGAYRLYEPFLLSFFVALLLVMATLNLSKKIASMTNRPMVTASIMTSLLVVLLIVPLFYLLSVGAQRLMQVDITTIKQGAIAFKEILSSIPYVGSEADAMLSDEKIAIYLKNSTAYVTHLSSQGFGFVKDLILMVIFYLFLNFHIESFYALLVSMFPVAKNKAEAVLHELSSTMEVVFYSIVVTAIFEGALFGIMAGVMGFDGLLLGVIYGFASLVPVVGGVLVWLPVSLFALKLMGLQSALFIAIYSIVVISIIADTFIKPIIIRLIKEEFLQSSTTISPLLIFFSILAGMSSYGFWGMIIGPAITALLIAIAALYLEQLHEKE